jgi:hypothetical protein
MLNQLMVCGELRTILMGIGNEIKRRYIAKARYDSGKLARSARVTAHRSKTHIDKRWYVDFTVGGTREVDYADDVEAKYGTLAEVLREMGYNVGDIVTGPTGRGAKSVPTGKAPEERLAEAKADMGMGASVAEGYSRLVSRVDRLQRPGRQVDSAATAREYQALVNETLRVQAEFGDDQSRVGWTALETFRALRAAKGLPPDPRREFNRDQLTQDMINERIGQRGGVTWEMRKRGSQSPYDRGEPDPLSNYFSPQELARYGLDDNGEPIPKPPRKGGAFWKEWTLDDIPDR